MHFTTLVGVAAVLAESASAHYIFSKLVVNNQVSNDWEYIRQTTRQVNYYPTKFYKTFDNLTPNDNDFRCNLGSFQNAGKTKVATVAAGDTLGMKLFYDAKVQHPGPGQVWMSKAPSGNVKEYEGDGEWFKIWEKTLCNENGDLTKDAWCTYGMDRFEFQIPKDTPAGEYLVRAEHMGLHGAQANEAEFYYSCAQVKVTGDGNGAPAQTYKIPGLYNDNMVLFNGLNLWVDKAAQINADIAKTPVGDAPWTGGGSAQQSSSGNDKSQNESQTQDQSQAQNQNQNQGASTPSNGNSWNSWNPWSKQNAAAQGSDATHTDANCNGGMH